MSVISKPLAIVAISMLLSTSPAMAESALSTCVFANMFGPNYSKLKILSHEYNCKKMVKFPLAGGGVQYSGQLSHHLGGAPDDQLYFQFTIKNGMLDGKITTKINNGGWGDLFGVAGAAIAVIYGVPISPDKVSELVSAVEQNVRGRGWQEVGGLIVGAVAAQTAAVASLPAGTTIRHRSSGKYLDAYRSSGIPHFDFNVVLRNNQNNDTQRWVLLPVSGATNTFTIVQKSSGRYLDAYQSNDRDYKLVTRLAQNNDTQKWVLTALPNGHYTFVQLSSGRFMDAHQSGDFQVVTRPSQNNDSQRWSAVVP